MSDPALPPGRLDAARAEAAARRRLVAVARGEAPADRVLTGATLVNVYTGELQPATTIAMAAGRIATVGESRPGLVGPDTDVVDLGGRYAAPGLVDAHYHLESAHLTPARHAEITLPQGTTALVLDPHEACASGGVDAIRYFLEASAGLPQKVYVQVSSATPPSRVETVGAHIGAVEAGVAWSWDRVLGLGEVMDPARVFEHDGRIWELLTLALARGEIIEGHSGYVGADLDAYAAVGVSDSHSPRGPEQALAMLRHGFEIQLKVDRSRAIVAAVAEAGIGWDRVGLAVDDRPADELMERGGLDHEVRAAIALGVPAVQAWAMASAHNARHWRLERDHGGIAPGRLADVVVLSDLERVVIDEVYADGALVGRAGALVATLPERPTPAYALGTVHLPRPVTADDVCPPASGRRVEVFAPPPFYTGRDVEPWLATVDVVDGRVAVEQAPDVNRIAVVERHRGTANVGHGFARWGLVAGAVASSMMHDSHNIVCVGLDGPDMARAVNEVAALGGGMAVVRDGEVLASIALPVFGLMSDRPAADVVAALAAVESAAAGLWRGSEPIGELLARFGGRVVDAITFGFLTCHPRSFVVTDLGLHDMRDERPVAAMTAR